MENNSILDLAGDRPEFIDMKYDGFEKSRNRVLWQYHVVALDTLGRNMLWRQFRNPAFYETIKYE